jgi:Haem-binding uptake, Tiki superfamily, ChaN
VERGRRTEWVLRVGIAGTALLIGAGLGLTADETERRQNPVSAENAFVRYPAVPHPAFSAIVRAVEKHSVVAIGESHDLQEAGDFYNALVRSRRLPTVVDDIIVEFGNAHYQDVIDRYVGGQAVPSELLERVWQDTTQIGSWDAPMYREFFGAVREANRHLEDGQQLRVLLGDPPIDWTAIQSQDDWRRFARRREHFMAKLTQREVLYKDRKALLIAGLAHVARLGGGVTDQLEASDAGSVFVVGIHLGFLDEQWQQQVEQWNAPSLVELAGTWIGRLPDGDHRAEDSLDGLLYLGPPGSLHLSVPPPSVYRDDSYWSALKHRVDVAYGDVQLNDDVIFGAYSMPIYADATIDTSGLEDVRAFSDCMRREGVESFPDPKMSFDSFGIEAEPLERAQEDPQFTEAQTTCSIEAGFGPPPPPPD